MHQENKREDLCVNKKVLLCERKRHTTRRVVSTPSVVLPGYPPPSRVPPHPDLAGGCTWPGYPPGRVPPSPPSWPGRGGGTWPGYPPSQGTPPAGYPPILTWLGGGTWPGYPPRLDLAGYPPTAPWHSGKCCKALWDMGTPPWLDLAPPPRCGQSENITFPILRMRAVIMGWVPPPPRGQTNKVKVLPSRRTTYAGGN